MWKEDAADHVSAEVDARESRHARPQQRVAILHGQLDAVRRLPVLVLLAFAADLRYYAVKDVIRKRARLETHGIPDSNVADLALRYLNAEQQLTGVGHPQDLRALLKVVPGHAGQILAKDDSSTGRHKLELAALASKKVAALLERGDETEHGLRLAVQSFDLQTFHTEVGMRDV